MVISETSELFDRFQSEGKVYWKYGNSVLYQMCENNRTHTDGEIIVGKLLLIGRTYAAALERRKNATSSGDSFYYDEVAPKMLEIGEDLDHRIKLLNDCECTVEKKLDYVLDTHYYLMNAFNAMTELNKRSLASKYLHFHCPKMFFIYDSRADEAVKKLVKRPNVSILKNCSAYDKEYARYVCRMLELQRYLFEEKGFWGTPRELDEFLLWTIEL